MSCAAAIDGNRDDNPVRGNRITVDSSPRRLVFLRNETAPTTDCSLSCLETASSQLIVMVTAFDAGAPGLMATRDALPAAATSLAGMATVTCSASTIVVVR